MVEKPERSSDTFVNASDTVQEDHRFNTGSASPYDHLQIVIKLPPQIPFLFLFLGFGVKIVND